MVVEQFVQVLEEYRIRGVVGDRYAGEWPRERFRAHGIAYQPAEKTKGQIYAELLPLLNSGALELLDQPPPAAPTAEPRAENKLGRPGVGRPSAKRPG